jgi:hypothetical protein
MATPLTQRMAADGRGGAWSTGARVGARSRGAQASVGVRGAAMSAEEGLGGGGGGARKGDGRSVRRRLSREGSGDGSRRGGGRTRSDGLWASRQTWHK